MEATKTQSTTRMDFFKWLYVYGFMTKSEFDRMSPCKQENYRTDYNLFLQRGW